MGWHVRCYVSVAAADDGGGGGREHRNPQIIVPH